MESRNVKLVAESLAFRALVEYCINYGDVSSFMSGVIWADTSERGIISDIAHKIADKLFEF